MNKIKPCSTYYLPFLAAILSFTTIYYLNSSILAETQPESTPYTSTEKYVIDQVTIDEVADLKKEFPEEADQVLRASFLEKLLTNSLKDVEVHRHGVRIKNVVINETLDLENAEIPHETWLVNCRLEKNVNFSKSIFLKGLDLSGSSFETANFDSMKVGGIAFFNGSKFAGSVYITDARFLDVLIQGTKDKKNFSLDLSRTVIRRKLQIENVNVKDFTATSLKVEGQAYLKSLIIESKVNLEHSSFLTLTISKLSRPTDPELCGLVG